MGSKLKQRHLMPLFAFASARQSPSVFTMHQYFNDKLHTNYVPTDAQLLALREYLAEPLQELSRYNLEIQRAIEALKDLEAERDRLHNCLNPYLALISPMRRLPAELKREIFLRCLPTDRNPVIDSREAPILFGLVCREWRDISLSTPRLWSKIHISRHDTVRSCEVFQTGTNPILETVRRWLLRSGNTPISASLELNDDIERTFNSTNLDFVATLVAFKSRWKWIHFYGPFNALLPLEQISACEVPWLASVSIEVSPYVPVEAQRSLPWNRIDIFQSPSLHHVDLRLLGANHFPSLPLPWERLTTLTLGGQLPFPTSRFTPPEAFLVLVKCPNLQNCKLLLLSNRTAAAQPFPDHPPMLTHYNLRTFSVRENAFDTSELFRRLHLPNVRYFESQHKRIPREPPTAGLLPNFDRLEVLALDVRTLEGCDIWTLLKLVPSISSLRLFISKGYRRPQEDGGKVNDNLLKLLMPSNSSDGMPVCPNLKEFSCTCPGFSDDTLLEFLQARAGPSMYPGIVALEKVCLRFGRSARFNVVEKLGDVSGLSLDLSYRDSPLPINDKLWVEPMFLEYGPYSDI